MEKIGVLVRCPFCGAVTEVEVDETKFERWQNGELIQRVFPEMSGSEREMLISGTCLDCQKKFLSGEEE